MDSLLFIHITKDRVEMLQRERTIKVKKKKKKSLFIYENERRNNETVLQRFQSDSINEFHLFVPSREKGNEEIFR